MVQVLQLTDRHSYKQNPNRDTGSMITYARSVGNGLMKRREMRLKGVRKIKVLIQATELMGIYGIMSWPKEPTKREWFSDA